MTDLLINEIVEQEGLSFKVLKILERLNINSINKLFLYYYENKSFQEKGVCGKKSNQDLIYIINKYSYLNTFTKEIVYLEKISNIKNRIEINKELIKQELLNQEIY